MDITNENFLSKLPEIRETIQGCDFIAIDTELSGLMRERMLNRFDLPEERFSKALEYSRGYFIMQFGLSCFTKIDDLKYSSRTYNIYIFPQPHKQYGDIDRTFSIQVHAIQFLTEHNFDFNKLFRHGVSYLTFQESKSLTNQLKHEFKERGNVELNKDGVPKFVPSSMTTFCRDSIRSVKEFVSREELKKECSRIHPPGKVYPGGRDGEGPTLDIRDCGTHNRRNTLKKALESLPIAEKIFVDTRRDPDSNETYLTVEYIDKETKEQRQREALVNAKGFLEVIETIILNKKPIVGHNLSLDLVQIINQFIEELSDDYHSFKELCHSFFPLIYDTKYIAHSFLDAKTVSQNQSRLNDLYSQLKRGTICPNIVIEHLGAFFDENQLPHQAGYDAYMSGYSFISMCEAFLRKIGGGKSLKDFDVKDLSTIARQPDVVRKFANKIHLSFSYDFKFFDLSDDEPEPDRSHVFYVEFPGSWGLDDLFQLFSQLGGVEASKLNKTSALCALRDPKQKAATMQKAKKLRESCANHRIHTYESYVDMFKSRRKRGKKSNSDIGGDSDDDEVIVPDLGQS